MNSGNAKLRDFLELLGSASRRNIVVMEKPKARKHFLILITILLLISSPLASSESAEDKASAEQLRAIQSYIKQSWHTLTRSSVQLAKAAPDPKFKVPADGRWP